MDKPYRSLNEYYREIFGRKTAKISLDGGFTCPNRDGTCGDRGCLFCSAGGSGDFAENAALSITEQVENGKAQTSDKWKDPAYVAYFQAFTNTYAPVEELRRKYEEALSCEGVEGLSIATRSDCLPDDVLELLSELNQKTKLWVELGLQTSDEDSAAFIRRGYPLRVFEKAVHDLAERNIPVIVHVIIGLPGETRETLLKTIDCVNRLPVQGIKLQLLHVLADSDLAEIYEAGNYTPLSKEEYISLVGDCIARLREDIVIHRLTGDGDRNTLLAP
ncbi:MAG: TIGR01212 family radical SAM protein, partial [Anaerotignum sp.]|nr:TIGR01212 family radical SAM protein [Anaerotignum sp.]